MADIALSKIIMKRWASDEQRQIVAKVVSVGALKPTSILDVGCGPGDYLNQFVEFGALELTVGIDLSKQVFSRNAKPSESPKISFLIASVHRLPFVEDAFDVVFAKDLLHHVSDTGSALGEMLRVSRRYLGIVEANRGNLLLDMHVNFGHPHFTFLGLRAMLEKLVWLGLCAEYEQLYVYPFSLRVSTWNPLGLCWNMAMTFALLFASIGKATRLVLKRLLRHLGPSYNLAIVKRSSRHVETKPQTKLLRTNSEI